MSVVQWDAGVIRERSRRMLRLARKGWTKSGKITREARTRLRSHLARIVHPRRLARTTLSSYMWRYFFRTEGWFHEMAAVVWDCLLTFQSRTGIRGHLLEIGVWRGKSAILQAMHAAPDEQLVLVDVRIRDEMKRTIGRVKPSRAHCLEINSRDLSTTPLYLEGSRSYRWIHIDGEHTGPALATDLDTANHLLSAAGIVTIDDFLSPKYPQLTRTTFDYVSQHEGDLQMFLCGFNKAYLCRPGMAPTYLRFVKESLHADMRLRGYGNVTIFKTAYPNDMNCFGIDARYEGLNYRGPDADEQLIAI